MADLNQFLAKGLKIKGVQSGQGFGDQDNGIGRSYPISAVDPSKTLVISSWVGGRGGIYSDPRYHNGFAHLNNSTDLRLYSHSYDGASITWSVIEFEDRVSVQRGLVTPLLSTNNEFQSVDVPISPVDTSKSFFIAGYHSNQPYTPYRYSELFSNKVNFSVGNPTGGGPLVCWQVLEFDV